MNKLLDQIEAGLLKAQAIIDKKQSQIDVMVKERDELVLARDGAALSPLEADIERTKAEIEATQAFCNAAKKSWLKYQNEFIDLIETRTEANATLTDLQRKYLIMQEKKMKMQSDIETLKQSLSELKRRIDVKHGAITRINKEFSDEKNCYNNSVESIGQVSHQHLFSRICPLGGADQKLLWLFLCLVPSKSSFGLFLTNLG